MKLYVDFSALHQLAHKIGETTATFQLVNSPRQFDPIVIGDGREVAISDVSVVGGVLSYKGRQVVLYIKDHSYHFDRVLGDASLGNKFHLAHCSTLKEMIERKRYERYVVKNSVDRLFTISTSRPTERQAQVALQVCKNCLISLNYQGYKNDYSKRTDIVNNFDLNQFFAIYSSHFSHLPSGVETSSVDYSDNWAELSRQTRERRQFICADCGVNCSVKPYLSHVHHINGVKRDNSPENLEVLCADCHRKEHQGFMYVSHKDMRAINQLRADQGLCTDLGGATKNAKQ